MLVVKDDAYGHGLEPIVRRAWADGVRWFGAFDVQTGPPSATRSATTRGSSCGSPARDEEIRTAIALGLDIGVGDAELLEDVARSAARVRAPARVHLKIDSGLHRNGIRPEEWPAFVARAAALESGRRARGGRHLEPHRRGLRRRGRCRARSSSTARRGRAERAGLRPAVRHLAASAAAFARPEFRHDLVRVGAFAYGIRPAGGPDEARARHPPHRHARGAGRRASTTTGVHVAIGALHGLPSTLAGRVDGREPGGTAGAAARRRARRAWSERWPEALRRR